MTLSIIVVCRREGTDHPMDGDKTGFKCIKCAEPVVLGLMAQVAVDGYKEFVKLVCEECVPKFPRVGGV